MILLQITHHSGIENSSTLVELGFNRVSQLLTNVHNIIDIVKRGDL